MKFARVGGGLVFVVLLTLSLYMVRSNVATAPDFPTRVITSNDPEILIDIASGTTGSELAAILFEKKVIESSSAYFRLAVADKRSAKVSPGAHRLTLNISAAQALEQLLDPVRIPNLIKVIEGAWKSEIIGSLRAYGFSDKEITSAFKALSLPAGFKSAEGLLFPAQYSFPSGTSATAAVQAERENLGSKGEFARLGKAGQIWRRHLDERQTRRAAGSRERPGILEVVASHPVILTRCSQILDALAPVTPVQLCTAGTR
jgi:UPF0755 protein